MFLYAEPQIWESLRRVPKQSKGLGTTSPLQSVDYSATASRSPRAHMVPIVNESKQKLNYSCTETCSCSDDCIHSDHVRNKAHKEYILVDQIDHCLIHNNVIILIMIIPVYKWHLFNQFQLQIMIFVIEMLQFYVYSQAYKTELCLNVCYLQTRSQQPMCLTTTVLSFSACCLREWHRIFCKSICVQLCINSV